jgi:ABC-type lipoprotein release transport system permease subunit
MKSETRIPFFLIGRHLRHCNKWTLALIIFLLSVAFINLIFINSLFNGVVENNSNQFIHTYTGNITLTPAGDAKTFDDGSLVVRQVEKNPGVTAATSELVIPATLRFGDRKGDWKVTAIDPDQEKKATTISRKMIEGAYLEPGDADGIIIGSEVAGLDSEDGDDRGLRGIQVGDRLTATVDDLPARQLTVRGIFRTRFNRTDDRAFVTRAVVDQFPQMNGRATQVIVRTRQTGGEDGVVAELKAAGVSARFLTWKQASKGMQ